MNSDGLALQEVEVKAKRLWRLHRELIGLRGTVTYKLKLKHSNLEPDNIELPKFMHWYCEKMPCTGDKHLHVCDAECKSDDKW